MVLTNLVFWMPYIMNFTEIFLAKNLLKINSYKLFSVVPSLSVKLCSNGESINKYEEEI